MAVPSRAAFHRIGAVIGRLSPADLRKLDAALAFVLGLGD
jgi:hypothetical protein